jgi:hypothetical protein
MRREVQITITKKWTGPYGGVPAFNEYNISIKPTFDVAIGTFKMKLRQS